MTQLRAITEQSQVIVTCGTGGVGKTSVAAALGVVAAQQGRRVVVVTIDPARRLLDAIGLEDNTGNEIQQVPLDSVGELWVTMLDVRETFDSLVRDTSPTVERANEVMQNSFYRSLSKSLSGTRDYMAADVYTTCIMTHVSIWSSLIHHLHETHSTSSNRPSGLLVS